MTQTNCKIPEVSYLGTQNVTERGFECQAWDKQYPHRHSYGSYPGARDNYCRDFDSDEPWCLTTNRKVVWDRCIVPSCGVNVTANSSSCASIDELDISELKNERSCGSYCNWIRTTINDAIRKRNLQNGRTCGIRDKKKIVRKHEQLLQRGTYTPWMCSISIFDGNKDVH
ncbi:hepatocyte growth factor-like protein [Ostrea edulis]|uniref:hepatocyte growth factor-like protein n=1 Tax=Ostrea edulis TaxID=37623 RepID=UPI0024AFE845|nr:hepatocyte growth factor-like protein [Ostrea edulis]